MSTSLLPLLSLPPRAFYVQLISSLPAFVTGLLISRFCLGTVHSVSVALLSFDVRLYLQLQDLFHPAPSPSSQQHSVHFFAGLMQFPSGLTAETCLRSGRRVLDLSAPPDSHPQSACLPLSALPGTIGRRGQRR